MTSDPSAGAPARMSSALRRWADRPLPGVGAGLALLIVGIATALLYAFLVRNAFSVFLAMAFVSPFVFFFVTSLLAPRTTIHPAAAVWCFAATPALAGVAIAVRSFWPGSWMLAVVALDACVIYGAIAGSRGLARWRAGPSTQCLWCGYNFKGLASRGHCPECGRQYKRKTENEAPTAPRAQT